ncbi:uncharacterized protein LOC133890341 [Phragmites australis]|uniref:uncharacterized protein LOC133890341 n=1 Tax=Phragmites australis TaxID=29695 RepID=UPI002D782158|nr:uncharacterized protein LOC133890341 [Phragmites australis]
MDERPPLQWEERCPTQQRPGVLDPVQKEGFGWGNQLSTYIFLVISYPLHNMIVEDIYTDRLLHPLSDTLPCLVIQYADDMLILLRADITQVQWLKALLDTFVTTTELQKNFHKSIYAPIHVLDEQSVALCGDSWLPDNFGLLLLNTKILLSMLDKLIVQVECCILGWSMGLLSSSSCLTLTDTMLPSMLVYTIPVFLLQWFNFYHLNSLKP